MNLEDTKNELFNIRKDIENLKLLEEIYLLAKFCHDAKNILRRESTEEIKIYWIDNGRNILQKFKTEYIYNSIVGNKHPQQDDLHRQLRVSNGEFRTDEYLEEYKLVAGIMEKKIGDKKLVINKETTPEEFLKQIDPTYPILYTHHFVSRDLTINQLEKKPKTKL
jgi:hypothetical protein